MCYRFCTMETDVSHGPEAAERAPAVGGVGSGSRGGGTGSIDVRPLATRVARIQAAYHPEQIWLFGSRARGNARADSDWDLFVVVPDDIQESNLDPLVGWQLQRGSGVYADVIPCRAGEFREDLGTVNTLSYAVASEGVLIYER